MEQNEEWQLQHRYLPNTMVDTVTGNRRFGYITSRIAPSAKLEFTLSFTPP